MQFQRNLVSFTSGWVHQLQDQRTAGHNARATGKKIPATQQMDGRDDGQWKQPQCSRATITKYSYCAILIIYSKYKKQTNPFRKMKGCVINDVTAAGEKNREESVNENNEATRPLSCFLQGSVLGVHSIQQEISNKIATKYRSSFRWSITDTCWIMSQIKNSFITS